MTKPIRIFWAAALAATLWGCAQFAGVATLRGADAATVDQAPEQLLASSSDDDDVWAVALRVPAVLLAEVPLGIVRRLAEQIRQEQRELASELAAAFLAVVRGIGAEEVNVVSLGDVIPNQ